MQPGHIGRIGWIDLTRGTTRVETLPEETTRTFLGGKALGAHLLYQHLKPHTDPYAPENLLLFLTGPLTGTRFPAVSRSGVMTRSPLTGTFLDSYSGGIFGARLRWAGLDGLVVAGRSAEPAYLLVEDGRVQLRSARDLWGLSVFETERRLKEAHGGGRPDRTSVAAIGIGGENRVRYACIVNEKRVHGRGGAGAVMGSKNLKAVVVRGERRIPIADEAAFQEIARRCLRQTSAHPVVGKGGAFRSAGTMRTIDLTNATGTLPTRNWQENTFAGTEEINADAFHRHQLRPRSCYACPIGCSRDTRASRADGEYITEGPDYETMYAFGANCGVDDPGVIIAADQLCDDYGIDTISCGVTIGFAMECRERGLLSDQDVDGLDLRFGNGEALLAAVHCIARREGVGALLAEGVKRASEQIPGSRDFAIHVKGMELPGYDPRGMKGQGLTYAVSDRGGCHVRANTLRTELMGLPVPVDRYAYAGKAGMVRELQIAYASCDCVIACLFGAFAITQEDHAAAIAAATGRPFTRDDLRTVAERAWNLTRLFNLREGFGPGDDTLPERLFSEASTAGPSQGEVVDRESFAQLRAEYYAVMGWDRDTGVPTAAKLRELGLERREQG
ncbi:MAG: aldehyde ferredoxin oxidoreductase family protein [Deferrisomatales bacterium]|nr:aldehyde ferredoxin oxidoreductase family protein [Deferrisomatales bacterium]